MGAPTHSAQHAVSKYKDAQVPARMSDELLQVQDSLHAFNRPKRSPRQVYVGHPQHTPAFRSEEWLDYDVATEILERFEGGVGVLTNDGSGNSQAGGFQASAGEVFVHTRLESPRRVQDRHPSRLESVQHVHSENHLLQRPWRHRPDHDGVKAGQRV